MPRSFTPPTVKQGSDDHFFGRFSIDVGQSVFMQYDGPNVGHYALDPYPWAGHINVPPMDSTDNFVLRKEGVDYFLGGRTYYIDADVAAQLEADGFTVVTIGFAAFPFGEGAGPFGD